MPKPTTIVSLDVDHDQLRANLIRHANERANDAVQQLAIQHNFSWKLIEALYLIIADQIAAIMRIPIAQRGARPRPETARRDWLWTFEHIRGIDGCRRG
jgi:hypothetical protein